MPDAAIGDTMTMLREVMADARDDYWVIGSAAVRLHGIDTSVGDVDVLLSDRDAIAVLERLGLPPIPGVPDARFRSYRFGRWTAPPLMLEFMAGLEVRAACGWRPVETSGWRPAQHDYPCPVPDRVALIALLRSFGRAKDMERAACLSACGPDLLQR